MKVIDWSGVATVNQTILSSCAGNVVSKDGESCTLSKVTTGESKGNYETKKRERIWRVAIFFLVTHLYLSTLIACRQLSRLSHPIRRPLQCPRHRSSTDPRGPGEPLVSAASVRDEDHHVRNLHKNAAKIGIRGPQVFTLPKRGRNQPQNRQHC